MGNKILGWIIVLAMIIPFFTWLFLVYPFSEGDGLIFLVRLLVFLIYVALPSWIIGFGSAAWLLYRLQRPFLAGILAFVAALPLLGMIFK